MEEITMNQIEAQWLHPGDYLPDLDATVVKVTLKFQWLKPEYMMVLLDYGTTQRPLFMSKTDIINYEREEITWSDPPKKSTE